MLRVEKISKTFNIGTVNEKLALDQVDLQLNERDFITVIGGNGAEKARS
jgi:putative ABC transport system ATP-binding protein